MTQPIGTWRKQLANGESSEVLTIVGYDPKTKNCTANSGRQLSLAQLQSEYKYFELEDLAPNPYKSVDKSMLSPEIQSTVAIDRTDVIDGVQTMNFEPVQSVVIQRSPEPLSPEQLSPEQSIVQNAIEISKKNASDVSLYVNLKLDFDINKVCKISHSADIDTEVLASVLRDNIKIDVDNIVDALIKEILYAPKSE